MSLNPASAKVFVSLGKILSNCLVDPKVDLSAVR